MADLQSLAGIAQAREDLYRKMEDRSIPERQAQIQARLLEDQVKLKLAIPSRLLAIISKGTSAQVKKHGGRVLAGILEFATGEELPAIEDNSEATTEE